MTAPAEAAVAEVVVIADEDQPADCLARTILPSDSAASP